MEYDGLVKRDRLRSGFAGAATLCLVLAATTRLRASASSPCLLLPVIERAAAPAEQPTKDTLTIASLNMAGQPRIADALAAWIELRGIDVLLLQEVGPTVSDGEKFALAMSTRLGFNVVFAPAYSPQTYHQGLAIMSRYPLHDVHVDLLSYHHLHFRWRCRNVLAVTVATTVGSIRTVDVHLDTRINSRDRVAQLTPVVDSLKQTDGPQNRRGRLQHGQHRVARLDVAVPLDSASACGGARCNGDGGIRDAVREKQTHLQAARPSAQTRLDIPEGTLIIRLER